MSKHILIIGGGVIGLSVAEACTAAGHEVTVLERQPEERDGCSYGNAGMVVPSHFIPLAAPGMVALGLKWMWNPESPFYIKPRLSWELLTWGMQFWRSATAARVAKASPILRDLGFASRARFDELAGDANEFGLVRRGLLMLCQQQKTLDEEAHVAEQARALGIPAEVHDAAGTAALDPAIKMNVCGSVYFPRDAHLSPWLFMQFLQQRVRARGGLLKFSAEVTSFVRKGNRIAAVKTSQGEFTADEIVIAGGSWSPLVARELGLKIPLQPGKGYSLTLPNPKQLPQLCSICTEARLAVTPMGNSLRFGGTMEMSGLNETIDPRRVKGVIRGATTFFPEFAESDFADIKPWCGLRPCSPDGLPYIGRTAKQSNLIVATGHAMMGLSLAPITGRLVAEVIEGTKPCVDLKLLSPDRF
ncbi:NAD(P)/FAD-dependent oxidoreductase [Anatilimnocola floriformis]|uniref:NAD(P)/FAD-dependent oxidoreductase n=1 Tax=Anatilimnocola floriformis TaxID=2948575 RepID=UPI0020C3298C|nr:FAD-dependent oxidoreductase [Anatilimnocola floriformis]